MTTLGALRELTRRATTNMAMSNMVTAQITSTFFFVIQILFTKQKLSTLFLSNFDKFAQKN